MYLDDEEGSGSTQATQLDHVRSLMMDHAKLIVNASNEGEALKRTNEKLSEGEGLAGGAEVSKVWTSRSGWGWL